VRWLISGSASAGGGAACGRRRRPLPRGPAGTLARRLRRQTLGAPPCLPRVRTVARSDDGATPPAAPAESRPSGGRRPRCGRRPPAESRSAGLPGRPRDLHGQRSARRKAGRCAPRAIRAALVEMEVLRSPARTRHPGPRTQGRPENENANGTTAEDRTRRRFSPVRSLPRQIRPSAPRNRIADLFASIVPDTR